jgi:hypothetical protein
MDFDPQDQEIIRLLTRLKDADVAYPQDMLAGRRGKYLKQMAEVELGSGADTGIKNSIKDGPAPSLSPAASTLLEGALVVAIIAETGAMAYFYRDKLADFFHKITTTSKVQEVPTQLVVPTVLEIQGVTPSPAVASTLPSATIAASPTETAVVPTNTPTPGLAEENSNATAAVNQTDATPAPNEGNGSNGNNGNHYGQTPKPERTKENNGNNNNNGNQNESNSR